MTYLAGTLNFAIAFPALAISTFVNAREFDNHDAMSLSQGKRVVTGCSINWKNPEDGRSYCVVNARNQFMFKQNAKTFVPRARKVLDEN